MRYEGLKLVRGMSARVKSGQQEASWIGPAASRHMFANQIAKVAD